MRQIVCLSHSPWQQVPTRTQQLMTRLRDAQILFFEPPAPRDAGGRQRGGRRVRPGILVYPLPPMPALPANQGLLTRWARTRTVRFLQDKLEKHHFREPVFWCDSPAGADYLDAIAYRGLVYDCAQFWDDWTDQEQGLAAAADVVFAASPDLRLRLSPYNANVALLPQGCSYPMFAKDDLPRPEALGAHQGPVFGFVGTLWPDLDLTPLLTLADARPDCRVVLVGRDAGCRLLPELLALPNVQAVGEVSPADVPDYLHAFDVCLLPLRRGELDSDMIPGRLFEYLASGKPVVAMLRPEQVEYFPDVVYGAHAPAEFALLCSRALEEAGTWARDRRRAYSEAASWSHRAQEVERILESIGLF